MEILESQSPEKRKLIEASERHKKALEREVTEISSKTEKVITNALIIGGALALSYIIVRQLSSKSKKKQKKSKKVTAPQRQVSSGTEAEEEEEESPSMLADIGNKLASQATVILVDIARQKLMEYLESRKKADEAS